MTELNSIKRQRDRQSRRRMIDSCNISTKAGKSITLDMDEGLFKR